MKMILIRCSVCLLLVGLVSCSSDPEITRIDPSETTDLSGSWNDSDARKVSETVIPDCLDHSWVSDYTRRTGKRPVVVVGTIRNKTYEHIATDTFVNDLQRALVNAGTVSVVARDEIKALLRQEKYDQAKFVSEETMKEMGREIGADFMLFGSINAIQDQIKGKKTMFYQIDLELIDIETNEKVWLSEPAKIKKIIKRPKFGL
ncbi:MAG: penicillin-binding protein activator LpoB [Planctomycetes bacterium]|nr:penicillin-binding protein activator LpoB [Planctomycetota bacterium]